MALRTIPILSRHGGVGGSLSMMTCASEREGGSSTGTGHGVKGRAATRAKPALVNAVHAFNHGEDAGIEHPDQNITQHSSTGARYSSLHASYASMDACNTRGGQERWCFQWRIEAL